jgi:signal-transduction protein with cAMP-binding, CBS, and nucleotidyltransferase domain
LHRLEEAERMLKNLSEKENMNYIIEEIEGQYRELEAEMKRYAEIDYKELKKMEQERLKRKLKVLEEVQKEY